MGIIPGRNFMDNSIFSTAIQILCLLNRSRTLMPSESSQRRCSLVSLSRRNVPSTQHHSNPPQRRTSPLPIPLTGPWIKQHRRQRHRRAWLNEKVCRLYKQRHRSPDVLLLFPVDASDVTLSPYDLPSQRAHHSSKGICDGMGLEFGRPHPSG